MSASVENPPDCLMWQDAFAAKYDGKGKFGKDEWDKLLGHCQVSEFFPVKATQFLGLMPIFEALLGRLRLASSRVWQRIDRGISECQSHLDRPRRRFLVQVRPLSPFLARKRKYAAI